MKKFIIICILPLVSLFGWSSPLPVKLTHNIIIDTDCAIDDLRAISLLLFRPEISTQAILVSGGSLPSAIGYNKVLAMLHELKFDSIPVGCGESFKEINPSWRPFAEAVIWGKKEGNYNSTINAVTLLKETLIKSNEKLTLVCLGPLENISQLIAEDASIISKIERIIWYNESVQPMQGFNYEYKKNAADLVFKSGVRIDVISNINKEECLIDAHYISILKESGNPLSRYLFNVHNQTAVQEKLKQNHLRLCDDLVPVYITNPELFNINRVNNDLKIRYNQDYDIVSVKEAIGDMIKGTYVVGKNVVFSEFPHNRELYTYDVRQIMDSAISKYGLEEWKANVMTDEFHGHLGVFSIVGAKMGIKAREIFRVDADMLEVVTFAGSKPPYSCLNDGIQVSTGATLGMGTIRLSADTITRPSAIFTYNGHSIQITLKKEYLKKVDEDIHEGIVKFGLMDDGYWKLIRRNALIYWLTWNRNDVFDVKEIN